MPATLPDTTGPSANYLPHRQPAVVRSARDATAWILVAIGLLAFGLRWAAVAFHPQEGHYLHHDASFYLENARSILATGLPGDNEAPLGFSYVLCLVLRVGGDVHFIAFVLQPLVGAVNCLLIYFLCRQYGHPTAGIIAATAASVHPTLINSASQILTEPWATLFILCALIALSTKKKSTLLLAGLLTGFACTVRAPNLAVLLGFSIWWIVRGPARGLQRAAPFLAVALVPIAAVSIHLSVAHHRPVFLTLQSREASFVQSVPGGFLELEHEQEQKRGGYFEYGLKHPMRFLQERFFSFSNFVSPWPLDDDRSVRRKAIVTVCDGSILLAAALAALVLWKRQRRSEWFVLLWLPCCVCLFYTAFFAIPRYRVPTLPLLIAFAALVFVPQRDEKHFSGAAALS